MTTTHGNDTPDVSLLAAGAFEAAIARQLAQEASVEVRTLLGTAFATAFEAIEAASGTVEVDEGWRLPGSLDRLRHLDAAELADPDWQADVLPEDREELVDLLSQAVDELEWLGGLDDSGYAGFTSSGATDIYAVHHGGRVFWFQTNMDIAEAYVLEYAHAEGDEAGRRRLLEQLIEDFLFAGFVDVSLSWASTTTSAGDCAATRSRSAAPPGTPACSTGISRTATTRTSPDVPSRSQPLSPSMKGRSSLRCDASVTTATAPRPLSWIGSSPGTSAGPISGSAAERRLRSDQLAHGIHQRLD